MPDVFYSVNLNATRGGIESSKDPAFQKSEAMKQVKLFHVPTDATAGVSDSMVPDHLVSDSMIERFLAIEPPVFRVHSEFDVVIDEIERDYVLGLFFSAFSAAVVTVERLLNVARIELHLHMKKKIIKQLWGKGPTNEWQPNIDALVQWGYISSDLAKELKSLYELRCKYLHSGKLDQLESDATAAIHTAYELLKQLIGFPEKLFKITSGIECLDPGDPLFKVFYAPTITTGKGGAG